MFSEESEDNFVNETISNPQQIDSLRPIEANANDYAKNADEKKKMPTCPQQLSIQGDNFHPEGLFKQDSDQDQHQQPLNDLFTPLEQESISPNPQFAEQINVKTEKSDDHESRSEKDQVEGSVQQKKLKKSRKYMPPHLKIEQNEEILRKEWNPTNTKAFVELVPRYKHDWKKIAKRVRTMFDIKATSSLLRNFFYELTRGQPKCKKINFTRELDAQIAYYVDKFGLTWVKVAQAMDISDPMKIKNRYYSQIKKKDLFDELLEEAKSKHQIHQEEENNSMKNSNLEDFDESDLDSENQVKLEPTPSREISRKEIQQPFTHVDSEEQKLQKQTIKDFGLLRKTLSRFGEDFFDFKSDLNTTISEDQPQDY